MFIENKQVRSLAHLQGFVVAGGWLF